LPVAYFSRPVPFSKKFLNPQSKSSTIHHSLLRMLASAFMTRQQESIGTITRAINILYLPVTQKFPLAMQQ